MNNFYFFYFFYAHSNTSHLPEILAKLGQAHRLGFLARILQSSWNRISSRLPVVDCSPVWAKNVKQLFRKFLEIHSEILIIFLGILDKILRPFGQPPLKSNLLPFGRAIARVDFFRSHSFRSTGCCKNMILEQCQTHFKFMHT